MGKKPQKIRPEDIEVRDLPRRKFVLGAGGTVVAVAGVLSTGCSGGSDDCDTDPNIIRADADAGAAADPIVTNPLDLCDTD